MRNLAEQQRIFWVIVYLFASWAAFVLLFLAVFFSAFFPRTAIAGYHLYGYDGAAGAGVAKGSYLVIKDFHPQTAPLQEGKVFTFITEEDSVSPITGWKTKAKTYNTRVLEDISVSTDGTYYIVVSKSLDGKNTYNDEIRPYNIVGSFLTAVPYAGYVQTVMTKGVLVIYSFLFILFGLLIVLPCIVTANVFRKRYRKSPFPEGLQLDAKRTYKEKLRYAVGIILFSAIVTALFGILIPQYLLFALIGLAAVLLIGVPIIAKIQTKILQSRYRENEYIHSQIKKFFLSGKLKISKGFDCDNVYIGGDVLFAKIACIDRDIYVLINKDFIRYDNRLDLSGRIRIEHVHNLETAKDRIMDIYSAYFKQYKKTNLF